MPSPGTRREKLSIAQTFGLAPARQRIKEAFLAVRGQDEVPPSRWGLSSLKILKPWISVPTWLGKTRDDRLIPIYNFFNHTQTDPKEGWSVRATQATDFRGGSLTYDSHNGTDFVIPTGTLVSAAADGKVILVPNEFNRGGLKVIIDHGQGLVTSSNHLGRALVEVGQVVRRGEPVAYSGYSGIDGFLFFPWSAPHVHFNVFLNGVHVDPFARPNGEEESLWLGGGDPIPGRNTDSLAYSNTEWDQVAVQETLASCINDSVRTRLEHIEDQELLAAEVFYQRCTYPTRFSQSPCLYTEEHPRSSLLSLPFMAEDFVGVHY